MQLYLLCCNCNRKVILSSTAKTRTELANQWGYNFYINCPHCGVQGYYNVRNVFAETSTNTAPVGAIIGGLIGLIFGPEGALIGSILGGGGGFGLDQNERNMVTTFNNS